MSETAISGQDFQILLTGAASSRILFILDCCYAGRFAEHAPEVFLGSTTSEFRLLLGASGATQEAWDGKEETIFTKHLVRVLRGEEIVNFEEPGVIYVIDLLRHLNKIMDQEQKLRLSTLPPQIPQLVGFHVDPPVFVIKALTSKQRELKTIRYSKIYVRSIFRRAVLTLAVTFLFCISLLYTICDHLQFVKNESGHLILHRGFPTLHLGDLPEEVRELDITAEMLSDGTGLSRAGGTLLGTLSHDPLDVIERLLKPKYRFLPALYSGDIERAYYLLKDSLRQDWPAFDLRDFQDRTVTDAAWLLGHRAREEDRLLFLTQRRSTHLQVSSLSQVALSALDEFPEESDLPADARERTYRAQLILNSLSLKCTNNTRSFLTRLYRRNGFYDGTYIVDAILKSGCALSSAEIIDLVESRVLEGIPFASPDPVAILGGGRDYAQFGQFVLAALAKERSEVRRAALLRILAGLPVVPCDHSTFPDILTTQDSQLYSNAFHVIAKNCPEVLDTVPTRVRLDNSVISDLVRYKILGPQQLKAALAQRGQNLDNIVLPTILRAAGLSGDKTWIPTVLECLKSTDLWVRQFAIDALAQLGYFGDEPDELVGSETHPLIIPTLAKWLWLKDKARAKEYAFKNLPNIPNMSLFTIFQEMTPDDEHTLRALARNGGTGFKRSAVCLLIVRSQRSTALDIFRYSDLETQRYASDCVLFRKDATEFTKSKVMRQVAPESLQFHVAQMDELNQLCSREEIAVDTWARSWRYRMCVAHNIPLSILAPAVESAF